MVDLQHLHHIQLHGMTTMVIHNHMSSLVITKYLDIHSVLSAVHSTMVVTLTLLLQLLTHVVLYRLQHSIAKSSFFQPQTDTRHSISDVKSDLESKKQHPETQNTTEVPQTSSAKTRSDWEIS